MPFLRMPREGTNEASLIATLRALDATVEGIMGDRLAFAYGARCDGRGPVEEALARGDLSEGRGSGISVETTRRPTNRPPTS